MTEHDRNTHEVRRAKWPLRRMQDWILSGFTLTILGSMLMFGAKVIRTHSRWMDTVERVSIFQDQEEKVWHPRTIANEKKLDVMEAKFDLILSDLDEIKRRLPRRG